MTVSLTSLKVDNTLDTVSVVLDDPESSLLLELANQRGVTRHQVVYELLLEGLERLSTTSTLTFSTGSAGRIG